MKPAEKKKQHEILTHITRLLTYNGEGEPKDTHQKKYGYSMNGWKCVNDNTNDV